MSETLSKLSSGLHVRYMLFLTDFNETWFFSKFFSKNTKIQHFMKIRPVGAELWHADGQTDRQTERQVDMTKLIVPLRNFSKAPTKLPRL